MLPLAQRYGMGVLVWGPLGQGMLTGRARKGQQTDLIRASFFKAFSDEQPTGRGRTARSRSPTRRACR